MKFVIRLTPAQIQAAIAQWAELHAGYYGTPHGASRVKGVDLPPEVRSLAMPKSWYCSEPEREYGYGYSAEGAVAQWLTSGGNLGLVNQDACTLTYIGRRHGIGHCCPVDLADIRPEDVLEYVTRQPQWPLWATADHMAQAV